MMQTKRFCLLAIAFTLLSGATFAAGEDERAAKREERKKARGVEKQVLLRQLNQNASDRFLKKSNNTNGVTGFITYSRKSKIEGTGPYVAYVYVKWGNLKKTPRDDLEKETVTKGKKTKERIAVVRYDGYVFVAKGKAGRAATWGFAKASNAPEIITTPGKSSKTTWTAKAGSGTDAILVRLDMPYATGSGVIKAGSFNIPYKIEAEPSAKEKKKRRKSLY
jgi:hypothetical protein